MKSIKDYKWCMYMISAVVLLTTLGTELSSGFKSFLTGLTPINHHWVTKSFIMIIIFGIFYFWVNDEEKDSDPFDAAKKIIWSVVITSLIITAYYIWHYFA